MEARTREAPISYDSWVDLMARRNGVNTASLLDGIKYGGAPSISRLYHKILTAPRLATAIKFLTFPAQSSIIGSLQENANIAELETFWLTVIELRNSEVLDDSLISANVHDLESELAERYGTPSASFLKTLVFFQFSQGSTTEFDRLESLLLRLKYGEDLLIEVMSRCTAQVSKIALEDFKNLFETWDTVKHYSLDWAVMLNRLEGSDNADN